MIWRELNCIPTFIRVATRVLVRIDRKKTYLLAKLNVLWLDTNIVFGCLGAFNYGEKFWNCFGTYIVFSFSTIKKQIFQQYIYYFYMMIIKITYYVIDQYTYSEYKILGAQLVFVASIFKLRESFIFGFIQSIFNVLLNSFPLPYKGSSKFIGSYFLIKIFYNSFKPFTFAQLGLAWIREEI